MMSQIYRRRNRSTSVICYSKHVCCLYDGYIQRRFVCERALKNLRPSDASVLRGCDRLLILEKRILRESRRHSNDCHEQIRWYLFIFESVSEVLFYEITVSTLAKTLLVHVWCSSPGSPVRLVVIVLEVSPDDGSNYGFGRQSSESTVSALARGSPVLRELSTLPIRA